jgi:hypothetical protein
LIAGIPAYGIAHSSYRRHRLAAESHRYFLLRNFTQFVDNTRHLAARFLRGIKGGWSELPKTSHFGSPLEGLGVPRPLRTHGSFTRPQCCLHRHLAPQAILTVSLNCKDRDEALLPYAVCCSGTSL